MLNQIILYPLIGAGLQALLSITHPRYVFKLGILFLLTLVFLAVIAAFLPQTSLPAYNETLIFNQGVLALMAVILFSLLYVLGTKTAGLTSTNEFFILIFTLIAWYLIVFHPELASRDNRILFFLAIPVNLYLIYLPTLNRSQKQVLYLWHLLVTSLLAGIYLFQLPPNLLAQSHPLLLMIAGSNLFFYTTQAAYLLISSDNTRLGW